MSEPEDKSLIVRRMVTQGYASELRALLLGDSQYNLPELPGAGAPEDTHEGRLRTFALCHLRYVAITGRTSGEIVEHEGKFFGAYPAEFEMWAEAGAPGVTREELEKFTNDHPGLLSAKP